MKAVLSDIARVVEKQRRIIALLACLLLSVSILCFVYADVGRTALLRTISLLTFLLAFAMFYQAVRTFNPHSNELYLCLLQKPMKVVWIYHQVTRVMPFGIHLFERYTIFLFDIEGKPYNLSGSKKEIEPILKGLNKYCFRATFGYSVQKEQLFKASPALLLNQD